MNQAELTEARKNLEGFDGRVEEAYQALRDSTDWLDDSPDCQELQDLKKEALRVLDDIQFLNSMSETARREWEKQEEQENTE